MKKYLESVFTDYQSFGQTINKQGNYRTDLAELSGPIRIELKKLVSGQIFSASPAKCLPVRLCTLVR